MEAPILAGWLFWVAQMATNRSESRNGRGMSSMLSTTLNTAVFSVVESILLIPLPFRDSDRLVAIWATQKSQPARIGASMPEFEDYKAQSHSFEIGRASCRER